MDRSTQTRVEPRALVAAVVVGALVGFAVGGAYWAGGMAQAATQHERVSRLADAADGAFSYAAFQRAAGQMDRGALTIAQEHDPMGVGAGALERDRQASVLAVRLARSDEHGAAARPEGGLLLRASLGGDFNPAARPFRMGGALDGARDLDCLTSAVYYEARGESSAGQAAVAQVVLNRARHPAFPKTICGVVFQGAYGGGVCQFSFACDGSMRQRHDGGAWARARGVAARALSGYVMTDVGNATSFHTVYVNPGWRGSMMRVAQVGAHIFYRFGGHSGAPDAFTRQPGRSGPAPMGPPAYAAADPTITADGAATAQQPTAIVATAVLTGPGPLPAGMGGPAGPATEPASAPTSAKAAPAGHSGLDAKPPIPALRTAPAPAAAS